MLFSTQRFPEDILDRFPLVSMVKINSARVESVAPADPADKNQKRVYRLLPGEIRADKAF